MKPPAVKSPILTYLTWLSIALFTTSLFFEAYSTGAQDWTPAWATLLIGWMGSFFWYANPFLVLSWLLARRGSRFLPVTSSIALLISGLFLVFPTVLINEAGGTADVRSFGTGYWLWLVSNGTMAICGAVMLVLKTLSARNKNPEG